MTADIKPAPPFSFWERSVAMDAELAATGKSLGIDFNFDRILMTPNGKVTGLRFEWGP